MGFLSDIGGILPGAYLGFNKGVDDMKTRQREDEDRKHLEEQRDQERAMVPLKTEAETSRLRAQIEQDKIASKEGGIKSTLLDEQQKNLPKVIADAQIVQELNSAKTAAEAASTLLTLGGQALAVGDTNGLNKIFGHMAKSGLFKSPDGSAIQPPVSSSIAQAPKGSVDFVGQPIEGRAIQATMPDGSKVFINPKFMEDAYKRQQQASDMANLKTVKPGENLVNPRTGQVVHQGQPRLGAGGYIDPETGEFIPTKSASGSNSKAAKTPQSLAVDYFSTAAEKSETKLSNSQYARGQRTAEQIATQRGADGNPIPPAIAAEVAMEVVLNPEVIQPQVNLQTGKIEGVFSRRDLGDIVVEPWSPALQKSFTPEQIKSAAEKLVASQPQDIRERFVAAAYDPAMRKELIDSVSAEISSKVPAEQVEAFTKATMTSLNEKLDVVRDNLPAPKPKTGTSLRDRISFGGISGGERYVAPANSPAARAQARQAEARAKNEAQAQERAAAQAELSRQFRDDAKTMDPLDLARKYDSLRGRLPTEDAAMLQQIERNIR